MKKFLGVLAALGLLGAGALAIRWNEGKGPAQAVRAPAERPSLALLTSLPLLFAEEFSLQGGGSPALTRLEQRYAVVPIAVADAASLRGQTTLLMAHPRAQPAEALVDLDAWVRGGGRLLLLADPKLDWDSSLPLGDPLRPPPNFADTGLLAHWGLGLEGPLVDGPAMASGANHDILAASPGTLISSAKGCAITDRGFLARCAIGKGRVTVIADADFLNVSGPGALDGPTAKNLDLLVDELVRLESGKVAAKQ